MYNLSKFILLAVISTLSTEYLLCIHGSDCSDHVSTSLERLCVSVIRISGQEMEKVLSHGHKNTLLILTSV
jgi:hypothetical protein